MPPLVHSMPRSLPSGQHNYNVHSNPLLIQNNYQSNHVEHPGLQVSTPITFTPSDLPAPYSNQITGGLNTTTIVQGPIPVTSMAEDVSVAHTSERTTRKRQGVGNRNNRQKQPKTSSRRVVTAVNIIRRGTARPPPLPTSSVSPRPKTSLSTPQTSVLQNVVQASSASSVRTRALAGDPSENPSRRSDIAVEQLKVVSKQLQSTSESGFSRVVNSLEHIANSLEQFENMTRENFANLEDEVAKTNISITRLSDSIQNLQSSMTSSVGQIRNPGPKIKAAEACIRYHTYLEFDPSARGDSIFWTSEMENEMVRNAASFVLNTNNDVEIQSLLDMVTSKGRLESCLKRMVSRAHGNIRNEMVSAWVGALPARIKDNLTIKKTTNADKQRQLKVAERIRRDQALELLPNDVYIDGTTFWDAWHECTKATITRAHRLAEDTIKIIGSAGRVQYSSLRQPWAKMQYTNDTAIVVPLGLVSFVTTKIGHMLATWAGRAGMVNRGHNKPWVRHCMRLDSRISEESHGLVFGNKLRIRERLDKHARAKLDLIRLRHIKDEDMEDPAKAISTQTFEN